MEGRAAGRHWSSVHEAVCHIGGTALKGHSACHYVYVFLHMLCGDICTIKHADWVVGQGEHMTCSCSTEEQLKHM